ncbi:MFS transporter [Streptomyces sp. NPDC001380]|uniref:MFS transporter n=1 Tax=Streptomyces sp. NPDC001380 TaxID=3364566 RepID=UPI003682F605
MAALYGIVGAATYGWAAPRTLVPLLAGAALVAAFLLRQSRARTPLLPLRVLRPRAVAGANLVQLLLVAALSAFQVLVALYLQNVLGYGATRTGLAMLPAALAIGAVSLGASARLIARHGERAVLRAGLVLLTGALALLARLPVHADYVRDVLPSMLLVAGFGLAMRALTALGMSGADARQAGLVSGLFTTTQQIGSALGVALLSALAATRTDALVRQGGSRPGALTGGYHLAFAVGAGLLLLALSAATVLLRRHPAPRPPAAPGPASARRPGRRPEPAAGPAS